MQVNLKQLVSIVEVAARLEQIEKKVEQFGKDLQLPGESFGGLTLEVWFQEYRQEVLERLHRIGQNKFQQLLREPFTPESVRETYQGIIRKNFKDTNRTAKNLWENPEYVQDSKRVPTLPDLVEDSRNIKRLGKPIVGYRLQTERPIVRNITFRQTTPEPGISLELTPISVQDATTDSSSDRSSDAGNTPDDAGSIESFTLLQTELETLRLGHQELEYLKQNPLDLAISHKLPLRRSKLEKMLSSDLEDMW